ncbi:hypothetical protein AAZX31_17G064000 [Glycine max]
MKVHLVLFLLLILVSFTSNVNTLSTNSKSNSSIPQLTQQKRPDNETIYRVSKQLCWGCIAESLEFWELPLMWDFQLEQYARWWAGQRKADCKLEHSFPEDGFKLGENIYWGSGSAWTPSDAVRAWADEEKYYTYATNTCVPGQIIGCARVACDDEDVFMTCNYDPVGNYVGERPY